jgi:hypothetical protein
MARRPTEERVILWAVPVALAVLIIGLWIGLRDAKGWRLHYVTTHNMLEVRGSGDVWAGDAYRDKYGWLCVAPNDRAVFERSDVIVIDDHNTLLVCYWRER